jgi:hypothetical protein
MAGPSGVRPETESVNLSLTCPNCGNAENFVAKTLQMQLLRVVGDQMQPPQEEGRPALVEVLCDECDSSVDLDGLDDVTRRDLLVTLGAR